MTDYERGVLSCMLFKNGLQEILDKKIENYMFYGQETRKAFEYVISFFVSYGEIPSVDLMEEQFPDLKLPYVKEPVSFYIDKLLEQHVRNKSTKILTEHARLLVTRPMDGLETLKTEFARLNIEANPTRDVNLMGNIDQRLKLYQRMKNAEGMDGFPTPWDVLNEATMGWHGGEFVSIVARPAVGKTFLLTIFAQYAWDHGLSVMFVNNEMSESQIGKRFDAIHFKLPYKEFRAGLLPMHLEKKYIEGLQGLKDKPPLWIVSDVMGVASIAAKIDQYNPDIVLIDGMYLLRDDQGGRSNWEQTTNVSRALKRLAKQKNKPVIVTTQFNRETDDTRIDKVTLSNIGFSDSLGQDSDIVIGLFRNRDMEMNNEMAVRLLKVRESEPVDFHLTWDLKNMDFKVISQGDDDQVIIDDDDEGPLSF